MRNWSHHVPQSLLNSQINYDNKYYNVPKNQTENFFSGETIYIFHWEYHSIEWLENLIDSADTLKKMFSKVFQRMKKDYSKLIGKSVKINKKYLDDKPRPYDFSKIAQDSFEMNR